MSRPGREGFDIGDRSTRTLYDVRLVRAVRKVGLAAIVAWDAVLDASWESGNRVTIEDAIDSLPYELPDVPGCRAALQEVGLMDDEGRIRQDSWARWFGVAAGRREAIRERSRQWNARRRGAVTAPRYHDKYATEPNRPGSAGAHTKAAPGGKSLKDILRETGGEPDIAKGDG